MIESYVAMGIVGLFVILATWRIWGAMEDSNTEVEWYHLVSSEGKDGKQYASATKVCLLITFVISTILVTWVTFQVEWRERAVEVLGLITAWMLFGAGVEAYSKHLRHKNGS